MKRTTLCVAAVRLVILSVGIAGFAAVASANTEMTLWLDAAKLRGGEVCFHKTDPVRTSIAPQRFFFESRHVQCVPADNVLEMPVGKFLFFGRHPDGYVTPHRSLLSQPAPDSDECFSRLAVPVVPSAVLDFSQIPLDRDAYVGVWVEDTGKMQSTFLPSVPGETSMLVPADLRIAAMVIAGKQPRQISDVMILKRGERRVLRGFSKTAGRGDVVTWLDGNDSEVAAASKKVKLDLPALPLVASTGERVEPLFLPMHFGGYHGTLLIYKNVPAGPATVSMSGRWWVPQELRLDVRAGDVTVSTAPLPFALGAVVAVEQPLWRSRREEAACPARQQPAEPAIAALLRCPNGNVSDPSKCAPAFEKELPDSGERVELTGVPKGSYVAVLDFGNGVEGSQKLDALPGVETKVRPEVPVFIVYGSVKRGGEPVQAELMFSTLDRTVTNASGEYRVALRRSPERHPIEVRFCDGGRLYMHAPERAPSQYEAFDVLIPANRLAVHIRDATTGKPVTGARARFAVKDPDLTEGAVFTQSALTDEEGNVTFDALPPGRTVAVCATADGYSRRCAEPFTAQSEGARRLTVELGAGEQETGRILGLPDPRAAHLFFVSPDGRELSRTRPRDDGTFLYDPFPPATHLVVVAPDKPLTVIGPLSAPAKGNEWIVEMPVAPVRTFRIRIEPSLRRQTARIGIFIGDLSVPLTAFDQHQGNHGLQSSILNGEFLDVPDIAATAPIIVRLGPAVDDASVPLDAVVRAGYAAAFPAKRVESAQDVVFP